MSTVVSTSSARAPLFATLRTAACQALQWRLLLLWWAALCLPALLVGLPLWRSLAGVMDQSLLAPRLASGYDMPLMMESFGGLIEQGPALPMAMLCGLVLALLLSPWLNGMALTAARQSTPQGFGALLRGGLGDYGRMLRMFIWALPVLAVAGGIGQALSHAAEAHAAKAVLVADADQLKTLATVATLALLLLANLTLDAGRSQFVLQLRRTSAVKAWWRGCRALSWRMLLLYLVVTMVGLALAAVFSWLRLQTPGLLQPLWHLPGWVTGVVTLVAGQLVVLALAWMRCTRLFALTALSKAAVA